MKKINFPVVDDNEAIAEAATNNRLENRLLYESEQNQIQTLYNDYISAAGDGITFTTAVDLSRAMKEQFKKHYKSPPNAFSFIKEIRNSSKRVCPMCGNLSYGTVDHLFPQAHYSELSLFSKNLVPACKCNSIRNDTFTDTNDDGLNVRVLHPYFDHCLSEQLIRFEIIPSPNLTKPQFQLVYISPTHPEIANIRFHVSKIVMANGITDVFTDMWSSLILCPLDKIQTLPHEIVNIQEFEDFVRDAYVRETRSIGTPNNWNSIFYDSILNSPVVLAFLTDKHNHFIREN